MNVRISSIKDIKILKDGYNIKEKGGWSMEHGPIMSNTII